jgi:hypothetical protein
MEKFPSLQNTHLINKKEVALPSGLPTSFRATPMRCRSTDEVEATSVTMSPPVATPTRISTCFVAMARSSLARQRPIAVTSWPSVGMP